MQGNFTEHELIQFFKEVAEKQPIVKDQRTNNEPKITIEAFSILMVLLVYYARNPLRTFYNNCHKIRPLPEMNQLIADGIEFFTKFALNNLPKNIEYYKYIEKNIQSITNDTKEPSNNSIDKGIHRVFEKLLTGGICND